MTKINKIQLTVSKEFTDATFGPGITNADIVNAICALVNILRDQNLDMDEEIFDYKLYASIKSRGKLLQKKTVNKQL